MTRIDAPASARIVPHLWYVRDAEAAATLYASVFPDSRIDAVTALPVDTPGGPAGSVRVVEFTLCGQPFTAFDAGPHEPFNHAVSFLVRCDDQAGIDRTWEGLLAGGGVEERCGWLRDRWGVCWQVAPASLAAMMRDPDRTRAARVATAFLGMVRLDLAAIERAYRGDGAG